MRLAALTIAGLVFTAACGSSGGGNPVTPPPPPPPPPTKYDPDLGDIGKELRYLQTRDNGGILVIQNPNLRDFGRASTDPITGQRRVEMNPVVLAQFPPAARDWALAHEIGHHYLKCTPPGNKTNEARSDAYGIRTLMETAPGAESTVISFVRANFGPGDAQHASGAERAAYMEQVATAFRTDKTKVPRWKGSTTPQLGTIVVRNPFSVPVLVYLNRVVIGALGIGQQDGGQFPAGRYELVFQSQLNGQFSQPFHFTLSPGKTIVVP